MAAEPPLEVVALPVPQAARKAAQTMEAMEIFMIYFMLVVLSLFLSTFILTKPSIFPLLPIY